MNTAVYLINRTPCKGLKELVPVEAWSGKKPNLSHLKVFGCSAITHIPKQKRKKFDSKGKEVTFVGYTDHNQTYRFYDHKKDIVFKSRGAVFMENKFNKESKETSSSFIPIPIYNFEDKVVKQATEEQIQQTQLETMPLNDEIEIHEEINNPILEPEEMILRRSSRVRKPPAKYMACVLKEVNDDPKTLQEAIKSSEAEKWKNAMKEEYNSLLENQTWELVQLPEGKKPIDCKWTFKTKRDSIGNIERYKARLVIKGYSQKYGIDYQVTFSPVVRHSSIRLLLSIATQYDMDIDQMDVVTAFLQSDLEEEIYMKYPDGFQNPGNKVCKLKKSLYGLKQASRVWNRKLDQVLKSMELKQSKTDPCIYFKTNENERIYIAIYVDDILILTSNNTSKIKIKESLKSHFKMKDLGEASYILGMKITRDRKNGKLWIDQQRYVNEVIRRFNMEESNPISTPLDVNQKLSKQQCPSTKEEIEYMRSVPYQEAIGCIMYAAQITRSDLAFAVGMLSKFNNNPGKIHWTAVKRLLRYMKGTSELKLEYSKQENSTLIGYCDADWANDVDERKSTTGYLFKYQGGSISWGSKKQATVALSTTEAEYMALSAASQEAIWLKSLYTELLCKSKTDVKIYCDNRSAIHLSKDNMFHGRSKHIDIRHHFVRDLVNSKEINIEYTSTDDMAADVLTKGLPISKHQHCIKLIGCKF